MPSICRTYRIGTTPNWSEHRTPNTLHTLISYVFLFCFSFHVSFLSLTHSLSLLYQSIEYGPGVVLIILWHFFRTFFFLFSFYFFRNFLRFWLFLHKSFLEIWIKFIFTTESIWKITTIINIIVGFYLPCSSFCLSFAPISSHFPFGFGAACAWVLLRLVLHSVCFTLHHHSPSV